MSIFDAIKAGSTIVHADEDNGILWVWNGHCTVGVFNEAGEEFDCWNYNEAPTSVDEAVRRAAVRAEMLREYDYSGDQEEDDSWMDDDGQPDEAQEWYDFDPDC